LSTASKTRPKAPAPNNAIALFNRAILLERLELHGQAELDLKRYLEVDPSSEWSKEARSRLTNIRQSIGLHKDGVSKLLLKPRYAVQVLKDRGISAFASRDD
jgi:hypothetical protein